MTSVVHIVAHLGGGAGKILSGIAINAKSRNQYQHTIIILEKTINNEFEKKCRLHGIPVILAEGETVKNIIQRADIIQLDWWHHPLMAEFMNTYLQDNECRLMIWSHISGCNYPCTSYGLIKLTDQFVFATPYSYENPSWTLEQRRRVREDTCVVISSAIDSKQIIEKTAHQSFNVGYVGFLDYNKTNPEFVKYCENISGISNLKFIIVGDTKYAEKLINDVNQSEKMKTCTEFTGYSLNVLKELARMDVFGCLLTSIHTGSAENALLEAMAAGICPVVLNQCTEKYIVRHMETGILVNNAEEYGKAIKWLYEHTEERIRLGIQASKYVTEELHINKTAEKLEDVYIKMMKHGKKKHNVHEAIGRTPYEWFLSCYNGDINNISGNAFSETKASVKQYLKYFPNDKLLREVVDKNESRIKSKL